MAANELNMKGAKVETTIDPKTVKLLSKRRRVTLPQWATAWIVLIPALIFICLFMLYPIINTFLYAFIQDFHYSKTAGTNFAWDGDEWDSLGGVLDLSELVASNASLTPNLWNWLGETNIYWDQDLNDGTLWAIEGKRANSRRINTFIRQDWLDALGLKEPTNKAEFEANFGYGGPKILMWLGNMLLALLLVIVLYLSIYFTNRTASVCSVIQK